MGKKKAKGPKPSAEEVKKKEKVKEVVWVKKGRIPSTGTVFTLTLYTNSTLKIERPGTHFEPLKEPAENHKWLIYSIEQNPL